MEGMASGTLSSWAGSGWRAIPGIGRTKGVCMLSPDYRVVSAQCLPEVIFGKVRP